MYQGTTPTHIFNLPFSVDIIDDLKISYIQKREIVIEKSKEDCIVEEDSITLTLTEEETLKFSYLSKVRIEVKIKTGDKVLASVLYTEVEELINKEVFTG